MRLSVRLLLDSSSLLAAPLQRLLSVLLRLGKLWMLDSPGIFYALWKVVSPFVDSVTKAKIEFVDGHKAIEKLRAAIDPEASLVFLNMQSAALSLLQKFRACSIEDKDHKELHITAAST